MKKQKRPKVISVDFDGTLCQLYSSGKIYIPKKEIEEKPNIEVSELCRKLKKFGSKIVIHSSRWWGEYNVIKDWLKKWKIPFDDIILGKFKADVYIDDLSVNHETDIHWKKNIKNLLEKKKTRVKRLKNTPTH